VPSLILQPLIENAVVHGLAGHDAPVTITIEAEIVGAQLRLLVRNTTAAAPCGAGGIGLRNVRERLAVHFGDRGTLLIQTDRPDQWTASVQLPWLREPTPQMAGSAP
jgi:LytS/YehU family sensor histidine kinase